MITASFIQSLRKQGLCILAILALILDMKVAGYTIGNAAKTALTEIDSQWQSKLSEVA
jgi:hypothetical protein